MKYEFLCEECEDNVTLKMKPETFKDLKEQEAVSYEEVDEYLPSDDDRCDCDADFLFNFNPEGVEICWKGLQWADKNYREKKYRKNRSKKLKKKQKKVHHNPDLQPNYKGQRTENWREAKNKAKKDDHPRLETTYDPLIEEEEKG